MSIFTAIGSRRKIAAVLAFLLMFQMMLSGFASIGSTAHAADKPSKYITFLYNDFKEEANRLSFNGASTFMPDGSLRLTPAQGNQFGTVFNWDKVSLRDNSGFSTYFTFNMNGAGASSGVPLGADGLVFAVQTKSNSAGSLGGGMGFENIPNSVGVEFDTFHNGTPQWGNNGDPSDNHVAVDLNGDVSHDGKGVYAEPTSNGGIDFNSGKDVYVWIDYKTADETLSVYYNDTSTRPQQPKLTYTGLVLQNEIKSEDVYVGFTAATGSAWQNHVIKQWYFTNKYDPIDLNSATYVEAPSIMSVNAAVYNPPTADNTENSVQNAVYYKADLNLKDSKKNPGKNIELFVEKPDNVTFLDPDNEFAPLSSAPNLKTDENGNATYYYTAIDATKPIPSFRISTEYGAYYDVKVTTPPQVETGTPTPLYNAENANEQRAIIPVNMINTGGASSTWGVKYREKTDAGNGAWLTAEGKVPTVVNSSGNYSLTLEHLKEDTYYEVKAVASNNKGPAEGDPVQFAVQMPMPQDGVKYSRVGPSKVYYEDAESVQVVGENLYWLKKRLPYTDLKVTIIKGNDSYVIPRSDIETVGTSGLKIKLPKPEGKTLPLGKYIVEINHAFFDDKTFTDAIELTDDKAYRSINYEEVTVDNPKPPSKRTASEVDEITLRGPFVVNASEPGVYRLRDTNAVVTINDNLLFKGTELVIDNHNKDAPPTISGKGRLYVNGKNTIPILSTYTILEGDFEFDPENFSFPVSKAFDYTGMNMPVSINSFTFIKGGIRITGNADLGFKIGSTKIGANANVTALDFMKNRFDLAANLKASADFKSGPLEAAELRFSIDTRTPEFGVGASAELKKAKVGFDIDLLLKDKKLDSISFAVKKEIKIGSTGAQITKLGGGVSNMSALADAPLTFSVLGGLSDYLTPKIGGNYMVNGNDLRVDLSANHFGASGKLAIYSINVAGVDMFIVFNPTGYRGYDRAGFDMGATINVLDILVGQVVVKYFQGSSFTGYAKTAVQIPRSVPLVGGQRLSSAEVGVDSSRFRAALSVIGIGFVVKYPFATRSFDWDVDMASTLKNIGSAVVNTGKAVVNKIKSWFWYVDPNGVFESTAADFGDVPGVLGEKLFSQSGIRASLLGTYVKGRIATEVTETNPTVSKTADGKFSHAFVAGESYEALIAVKGDTDGLKLISPYGSEYELRFEKKDDKAPNAYYDAEKGVLVIEAALTPGAWKIVAGSSLGVTVHKVLYTGDSDSSIGDIAAELNGATAKNLVPLDIVRQGKYLVEIVGGAADAALIKADGRAYATEANAADAAWNVKRDDVDGTTWMLVEAPGAERWYVDAGADAKVNLYRMRTDATMSETMSWRGGSEFSAAANFKGLEGFQATLDIYGGNEDTKLYRPDGTLYPLDFDKNSTGWNAIYDQQHGVVTALVDVDKDGIWIVKSGDFTDLDAMTLSQKSTMADLYGPDAIYTYNLSMMEKGKYLLDIAGADLSTKIYGTDGTEIALNATPDAKGRNAILDDTGLKVTVDVKTTGTLRVQTKGYATIQQYALAPIPQVAKLTASAQAERNAYEVTWQVDNAKPDTKVRLIMANDVNEPVGQVLADNLPASGITTVTLPANNLPGDYYLALVADSESYAPVFKTLEQPISYKASQMLAKPANIKAEATGDAGVTISFTDAGYASTTAYRIYPADANGNVDYNGTSYEFQPDAALGANQRFLLAGLATEQAYKLRVMIVRASYESDGETLASLLVSELSDAAEVFLPRPNPAKLDVSYEAGDGAPSEQKYYPYDVKAEDLEGLSDAEKQAQQHTLVVTDSDHVVVHADSDQAATYKLYKDDVEVAPTSGDPAAFDLGTLKEGQYRIEIQATNAGGDTSHGFSQLIVDQTAPYLYLKTPTNGAIVNGSRARLEGATEAGTVLTVNDTVVPVDAIGHFVYYASFPEDGVLPLELIATDAAGNKTVNKLEVLASGTAATDETKADLAAFGTGEGVLDAPFIASLTTYKTSIDVREKQTRVWAVPVDQEAEVTIGGKPVDDQFSAVVDISNGSAVQAVVKSGGTTQTYSLNVTTESGLAGLKSLEVSGLDAGGATAAEAVELSKDYGAPYEENTVFYSAQVDNATASVRIAPEEASPGSLIRIKTGADLQAKIETVSSGQPSSPIALNVGSTKITIEVLSPNDAAAATQDWTRAKKYKLSIDRKVASDASLKQLALSGITLTPGTFDSAALDYNARVSANTSSAQLSFAAADAASVVWINGTAKGSAGTETLTLATGTNRFVIEVHAAGGTVQTYSLVIYRDTAFNASLLLGELSVKDMELTTEFEPLTRNYKIKDSTYNASITVIAKPQTPGATVKVNGKATDENGSATATLAAGLNAVQIQVTSPDQKETNLYSVSIMRNVAASEPTDEFVVKINDDENNKVATGKKTEENGKKVLRVSFVKDELNKLLASSAGKPVIKINAGTGIDRVTTGLTADLVKSMQQKEAILYIDTGSSVYTLPAAALDIAQIVNTFAPDDLSKVAVSIDIKHPGEDEQEAIRKQASKTGASVIGSPTDFSVTYTYNGKTIAADRFSQYVERAIELPAADAGKVTTGVRILEDGSLYHVPTFVKRVDERDFAVMNSFTNSVYALIVNKASFKDTAGRWSQQAIEDLASRTILTGTGKDTFEPARGVTRAEFAAMIVRALGLPAKTDGVYNDVKAADWYAPFVSAAKSYGLISGYPDGTFRPKQTITRAEAVAIIGKAWTLAGQTAAADSEATAALSGISDNADIPAWVRPAFGSSFKQGLISGYEDGSVKPLRTVTREETAAMLRNLLVRSELIESK